jgi:hypothetical protein
MDDLIAGLQEKRRHAMSKHAALGATQPFQHELQDTRRLVGDFQKGIAYISLISTRWSGFSTHLLSLRIHDHLL